MNPQTSRSIIETKIASLGSQHLVFEAIMTEYIKKPTLVYIKFWDDVLQEVNEFPIRDYGNLGVSTTRIGCVVKNYQTAFAPFLASKDTMKLYEKVRVSPPAPPASTRPNHNNLSLYLQYHNTEEGAKPVDFHFLEHFHIMNKYHPGRIVVDDGATLSQWWPNLVVRLSEIYSVVNGWVQDPDINPSWAQDTYLRFFGILAATHVMLQDHYILINRKDEDPRALADYVGLKASGAFKGYKLMERVKSYDVMGKLPTDLTSAAASDFDEEQQRWASEIEMCFRIWSKTPGLRPVRAYFVRWKTEGELEEERLNEQSGQVFCPPQQLRKFLVC
ncbi:hypothetical protein F5Y08DRAFT_351463 [Xylaria arbuscula]|nr:hypothetical protein F5Y08DRAFT_351463 [Xylaria arbuscula]